MFEATTRALALVAGSLGTSEVPVTSADVAKELNAPTAVVSVSRADALEGLRGEGRNLRLVSAEPQEAPATQDKSKQGEKEKTTEKTAEGKGEPPTSKPSAGDALLRRAQERKAAGGEATPQAKTPEVKPETRQDPQGPGSRPTPVPQVPVSGAGADTSKVAPAQPGQGAVGAAPAPLPGAVPNQNVAVDPTKATVYSSEQIAAMKVPDLEKAIVGIERATTATRQAIAVGNTTIDIRNQIISRLEGTREQGGAAQFQALQEMRGEFGQRRTELDARSRELGERESQQQRTPAGAIPAEIADVARDINQQREDLRRQLSVDNEEVGNRRREVLQSYSDRARDFNREQGIGGSILGTKIDPSSPNDAVVKAANVYVDPNIDPRFKAAIAVGTKPVDPATLLRVIRGEITVDNKPVGTEEQLRGRLIDSQQVYLGAGEELAGTRETERAQKDLIDASAAKDAQGKLVPAEAERLVKIGANLASEGAKLDVRDSKIGADPGQLSDFERTGLNQLRAIEDQATRVGWDARERSRQTNDLSLERAGQLADQTIDEAYRKVREGPIKIDGGGIRIGGG